MSKYLKYILQCSFLISTLIFLISCGSSSSSTPLSSSEGINELVDSADESSNLDVTLRATIVNSTTTQNLTTAAVGLVEPVLLEIDASTPKGTPFKALLLGSNEAVLQQGFSGEMRVRAKKTEVNGQALIAGLATFIDKSTPNAKFPGLCFSGDQRRYEPNRSKLGQCL